MKKNLLVFVISILLTSALSCKKGFLDQKDHDVLTREEYVTDLNALQEYLNGTYAQIATNESPSIGQSTTTVYPEIIADNIEPATLGFLVSKYKWSQVATDKSGGDNVNNFSDANYKSIALANFVIQQSDILKKENPSKAEVMKGQALCIRALSHFLLVNVFAQSYNFSSGGTHAGIVYVTDTELHKSVNRRNSVAEVYDKMINDLLEAIKILPEVSIPRITIGKTFAQALLARVYLFKEDFLEAKKLSREVSGKVPIMTVSYPDKLFTPEDTEALFQLPPHRSYTAFAGRDFFPRNTYVASKDITMQFQENVNDKRNNWIKIINNKNCIVKFPQGNYAFASGPGAYYMTVIRSSEMYLTAAECYAKLNMPDSARYYLDAIRTRAISTAQPTLLSGEALLDAIQQERRKELTFEGLRMFDLLRWKKGVHRSNVVFGAQTDLPYPNDKAIAPIPGQDVKAYGLVQNPGY